MKRILFLLAFSLLFISCSSNTTNNYKVDDFFVAGNFTYNGGFEGAGFKTTSKYVYKNGYKFILEDTIDTATQVQRVYLLTKDSIVLIFTGENTSADLNSLDLTKGEVILKAPFNIGNKWLSAGNKYEIIEYIDAESGPEITIEKTYPNGNIERIIYQKGFGKISKVLILGS